LKEALNEEQPEYVIIANKTSEHFETLRVLVELGFKGTILIEKPLFQFAQPFSNVSRDNKFVAYNLRFNPMIQKLSDLMMKPYYMKCLKKRLLTLFRNLIFGLWNI
jgi:predicted dehydrogenase